MDKNILFAKPLKTWAVYDMMPQQVHVAPNADMIMHELAISCECNPRVEIEGEGVLFVNHNAIDGRILLEDLQDQQN